MIDLRDAKLLDFVPPSISDDPEIVAMSEALDPEIQDIAAHVVDAIIMPRLDEQPEPVLDAVAWSMKLDRLAVWDGATLAGKRDLLREVFAVRMRTGTRWSVRRVFDLLKLSATIVEWFEEAGDPYTYRVVLDSGEIGITREQLVNIPDLLLRFGRASCKLSNMAVLVAPVGVQRLKPAVVNGWITTIGGP